MHLPRTCLVVCFAAARKSVLPSFLCLTNHGKSRTHCLAFCLLVCEARPPAGHGLHTHYSIEIAETAQWPIPQSHRHRMWEGFTRRMRAPGSRLYVCRGYMRKQGFGSVNYAARWLVGISFGSRTPLCAIEIRFLYLLPYFDWV